MPEKYINNRQSFSSKFEEETEVNENATEDFESIREKKKNKSSSNNFDRENKRETPHDFQFTKDDPLDAGLYFKDEALKLEIEKRKNIDKFLFVNIPAPRSPKMVDRLKLNQVTVGKGKMFGPEDYTSFTLITLFIIVFFLDRQRQYKTYNIENLENVNIYNALKPSEVVKIYEENEISPAEQMVLNSKEHQQYKEQKLIADIRNNVQMSASIGRINDVPKLDIKKKFKESLKRE